MSDNDLMTVVLDNGSWTCKAGFAGQYSPCCVFPTVMGRQNDSATAMSNTRKRNAPPWQDAFVGNEAQSMRDTLSLQFPIRDGIVTNWDDMGEIWHHTFYNLLRIFPEEHPVLLTEAPLNPKVNRETMTQIMFEGFRFPAMYVANQATLSLYATGRTTGVVLDCGHQISRAVPIYESYALADAVTEMNIGGEDLTNYLATMLKNRGCTFPDPWSGREMCQDIKEKQAFVAYNFEQEITSPEQKMNCELLDGRVISVGNERFRCPEALFQPQILGKGSAQGIHRIVYESIMKCDAELKDDLFTNIVLSGGSTMFPGIVDRMRKEMTGLASQASRVKIIALSDRDYCAWTAASMLASMPGFMCKVVLKSEYEEFGPVIVHRKCF